MDKILRSAATYTFGSSGNSRSSGKSKNSKSNKGDSKATREFIEKEIISTQTANEIKEVNPLTSFCDSDGQSYGTSEEENEIECSQQQSGQEVTMVGEPCYANQEGGQACLAVQEEDALSGDEICQQQCGQQEESLVQQPTEVDVSISSTGEACYATQVVLESTSPIEVNQQSTVTASEENEAGVICTESEMDGQSVQEVVEEAKIVEEVTKKTSIVSQESQKVSQIIDQIVDVFDDNRDAKIVQEVEAVAKTADISEKSQKIHQSISTAVAPCYAAEKISTPVEVIKQSTTATKSKRNVDTVDDAVTQVDSSEWCGIKKACEIETKKEITQPLITKTTMKVEMFLEAKSKFSATIEEGSEVLITAKFVNPLSTPLTDGKFWIEADNLGKPYCFEIPYIDAGETVICRALIFPRYAGYEFIVARFVSREIKRIVGFVNIRVSSAASYKSISEIVVPKITNQKVDASKKIVKKM